MGHESGPTENGPEISEQLLRYAGNRAVELSDANVALAIELRTAAAIKIRHCNLPESRGIDWALYHTYGEDGRKFLLMTDGRKDMVNPAVKIITNEKLGTDSGTFWLTASFTLDENNRAQYLTATAGADNSNSILHDAQLFNEVNGKLYMFNSGRKLGEYGVTAAVTRFWHIPIKMRRALPYGNIDNPFDQNYALQEAQPMLAEFAFHEPIVSGTQAKIRPYYFISDE